MMITEDQIKIFRQYMIAKGYRPQTAYTYATQLSHYFHWCKKNHLNPNSTTLDELYQYKRYHVDRGLEDQTIRNMLTCVKHYFISIEREDNPALLIKHKKIERTLPKVLLSKEELDHLYRETEVKTLIQRRDKVMLGMVIYQGLKREEINKIEINHINTDEGNVYISETPKTNSRTIDLNPKQMGHLLSYRYEYRPKLKELANKKETDKLFFSMGKGNRLDNAIFRKVKELKRQFPKFRNLSQVKESRMSIWVKEEGIRKAQYLSGIKYASSMMRYKQTDIEQLKRKLRVAHPMERLKL